MPAPAQSDREIPKSSAARERRALDPRISAALTWCRASRINDLTVAAPFRLAISELQTLLTQPDVTSIIVTEPPPPGIDLQACGVFMPAEYTWRMPKARGKHLVYIGGRDTITARMIRTALSNGIKSFVYWDLDRWTRRPVPWLALYKLLSRLAGMAGALGVRASTGAYGAAEAVADAAVKAETAIRNRFGATPVVGIGDPSDTQGPRAELCRSQLFSTRVFESPTRHRIRRLIGDRSGGLRLHEKPVPRRIVMACPTLVAGGAERQIVNTAVGLRRRIDADITILVSRLFSPPGNDFFHKHLTKAGVEVREIRSPTSSRESWRQHCTADVEPVLHQLHRMLKGLPPELGQELADTYLLLRALRPAVLHAWLDHSSVCAGLAALLAGVPRVILSGRNVSPLHFAYILRPYMRSAYRAMANRPETILVNNSRGGADDYARWLGLDSQRFRILYNGVDLSHARDTTPRQVSALRQGHGISEQALLVGGMFRLSPEKRPLLWVDTVTAVVKARADVFGIIFGAGPLLNKVKERIKRDGVERRIIVVPPTKDSAAALAAFDLLLLTSRWEGTPNVVIEAQATGTPVVVSGGGGAVEALEHGTTGLFVETADASALSAAVMSMVDDSGLRRRFGERGPAFVETRFGLERMLSETLQLYGFPQAQLRRDGTHRANTELADLLNENSIS
jgi:glycosyltransferase involved in cell wall biosynthesis